MSHFRLPLLVLAVLAVAFPGCKKKETPPAAPPAAVVAEAAPEVKHPASESGASNPDCIAPFSEEGEAKDASVGTRRARVQGNALTLSEADEDDRIVFGVLANLKEDTRQNLFNVQRFLAFFREQGADAILVPGDTGQAREGLVILLDALARSGLPVLVIPGNHEPREEYRAAMAQLEKVYSNIVDMSRIRLVRFDDASVVSLPGYYDKRFIHHEDAGCQYFKEDVDGLAAVVAAAKQPVVLLSHAEPLGSGPQAIDAIREGNAGDLHLAQFLRANPVPFGVFANIQEAGGRATDLDSKPVPAGEARERLYLNPGMGDATPWSLHDGTVSHGMAAVLSLQGGKASYRTWRAPEITEAELPPVEAPSAAVP